MAVSFIVHTTRHPRHGEREGKGGRDHMVVRFTPTCAINAYRH